MEVRLLGPVALWDGDHPVDLGPPQQRCVFAVLAMTPRQIVPVETLVARIWGDQVNRNVRTVLYTYVSRLRRILSDRGGDRSVLRRRDGGYVLDLSPEQVDLHRARRLTSQARATAARSGGDELAAALLAEACALWTGPPLGGVNGEWAERVRVGLEHERLALTAERFEAALRVGQHDAVVGPLSQALAAHPLTESLAGLLMLALYRGGRQAEALDVYSRLRRRLVDEVGDEPGAPLQRLHEQILRRAPELDLPSRAPDPRSPPGTQVPARSATGEPWLRLHQLPLGMPLVGRECDVAQLTAALQPDLSYSLPVVLVTGAPGVGKSVLATSVAQRLRDQFPDGQWYVRLGGTTEPGDPAEIAAELLEASGVDRAAIPDGLARRTAALRARLAGRRVLLLLDDAADAAQVRPLLPGTPGAAVLVTSRRLLSGLAASVTVRLDPLLPDEGVQLLTRLVGEARVSREPGAAAEVAAACGGLPLALRIAAARLVVHPEWTVDRLARRLRHHRRRLDELAVDDLAVRPRLRASYLALDPPLRTAFRRLGQLDNDVAAWTLGVLSEGDGEQLVGGLVTANLLIHVRTDTTGEPRYRLPGLVATYAAELAGQDPPEHRTAAIGRLLSTLLRLADGVHQRLRPDGVDLPVTPLDPALYEGLYLAEAEAARLTADPTAWLVAERDLLMATIELACDGGRPRDAALLAERVLHHLGRYAGVADADRMWRAVREAAVRAGDQLVAGEVDRQRRAQPAPVRAPAPSVPRNAHGWPAAQARAVTRAAPAPRRPPGPIGCASAVTR